MENFNRISSAFWKIKTEEGLKDYVENTIPLMEKMCYDTSGKWLMGTDEITLLDIWVGAWFEFQYLADESTQADDFVMFPHRIKYHKDKLQIGYNAPYWKAYVEKFREHPAIKPYRMRQEVFDSQSEWSREKEENDEYSRLCIHSMIPHYPELQAQQQEQQ